MLPKFFLAGTFFFITGTPVPNFLQVLQCLTIPLQALPTICVKNKLQELQNQGCKNRNYAIWFLHPLEGEHISLFFVLLMLLVIESLLFKNKQSKGRNFFLACIANGGWFVLKHSNNIQLDVLSMVRFLYFHISILT